MEINKTTPDEYIEAAIKQLNAAKKIADLPFQAIIAMVIADLEAAIAMIELEKDERKYE